MLIDLFFQGGVLFMSVLTLLLILAIVVAFVNGRAVLSKDQEPLVEKRAKLSYIKSIGTLAIIVGIFGQLLGLISAFDTIEGVGGVSTPMLMGGLKVSLISTLYGFVIFILANIIWLVLSLKLRK